MKDKALLKKNQNILVTGGAGFIGSHLCEKLLSEGHNVFCLDNFCDFYEPLIKRNNIKNSLRNPNFILLEGDIRDTEYLERVFAEYTFDTIIHLAAMAGVRPSIENQRLYYDVNINGTFNLLERAVHQKKNNDDMTHHPNGDNNELKSEKLTSELFLPNFIFASSSSVYGNNEKVPFSETDSVDNPISPYAVTKKTGELMCFNYHYLYKLPVICLRFFTVFGPRQRPDLAIHKFASRIIKGERIPVFGDGTTERDYTYIEDIIQGVFKAVEYMSLKSSSQQPSTSPLYEIFNLGESRTISLSWMIDTLEKTLGKKAKIERLPLQPGDVNKTYACIDKSRKTLDYNPTYSFNEGIKLFCEWLLSSR